MSRCPGELAWIDAWPGGLHLNLARRPPRRLLRTDHICGQPLPVLTYRTTTDVVTTYVDTTVPYLYVGRGKMGPGDPQRGRLESGGVVSQRDPFLGPRLTT